MSSLCRGPEGRWLMVLGLIALSLRLGWAVQVTNRAPRFDEVDYLDLATRLAQGEGFVDAEGNRVAYRPPGYPFLLSRVFRLTAGPSQAAAVGLQVILGVATCLLLSVVGERTLGAAAGRLAGLLLALYPTHVMYSTLHLTESLFCLLLLAAVGCTTVCEEPRPARMLVAGVLMGAASLTRPMIVLFPLFLPLAWVGRVRRPRRSIVALALVTVSTLAVVTPWLWRNQGLTGKWTTLTTSGGLNFWAGNHPQAQGGYLPREELAEPLRDGAGFDWDRGYRLGLEAIAGDPAAALLRLPMKLSHLVALETDGVMWNLKGFDPLPRRRVVASLLIVANGPYLFALATASLTLVGRRPLPLLGRVTWLLCGYMAVLAMIYFGDPRFHLPLMPFLLLFSASLFADESGWRWPTGDDLRSISSRRLAAWVSLMVVTIALMSLNLAIKRIDGVW